MAFKAVSAEEVIERRRSRQQAALAAAQTVTGYA
jgi:hypothetical protein